MNVTQPHIENTMDALQPQIENAASSDDDYYVVDEDGMPIEAAAEGSVLMAEGLMEMVREETGQDFVVVEPYVPDFDVQEASARAKKFLDDHVNARRQAAAEAEAPSEGSPTAEAAEGEEQDEEYDEIEEDGFPAMGSRDMTDPQDWELESILQRRFNRDREGGLWMYLCKWKRHEETSWETREVLEDAGYIPQVDAFDQKGVHKKKTNFVKKMKKNSAEDNQEHLESYFGIREVLVRKLNGLIKLSVKSASVMRYCAVNPCLAGRFIERWNRLRETHVPALVFHGTRAFNLDSIARTGLVVGGTRGVKVSNGSAYGKGVYTAVSARTPMSYSGCNALIVCIGLVPVNNESNIETSSVFQINDYLIFRSSDDVFPMWYIQYNGQLQVSEATEVDQKLFIAYAQNSFDSEPAETKVSVIADAEMVLEEALTESENRAVNKAIHDLKGSSGGGIRKSALKGQPRRIKELLARAAIERRK